MFSILRAFAWLRWRMLVNSFEKTGSRDALERFSIAIEKLGPLLAAILLVPSAIFLAGLGVAAGYLLATEGSPMPFAAARYLLLPVPVLAAVGPLFLPAADRTNPVRLLLLPISRSTLYVAQSSTAFGDPWNLLMVPLVAGMPLGLLVGGALVPALLGAVMAILLVVTVVGISSLATSVLHLVVRDRRRGELITLIFILVIPVVAMIPGLMGMDSDRPGRARQGPGVPAWARDVGGRALAAYPSEIFVNGTRAIVAGNLPRAGAAVGGLAAVALMAHVLGFATFARVLASPGNTGARRAAAMGSTWGMRVPGFTTGASAVALAHVRLAMRTPRGRSILLSPVAMFLIFGMFMYRTGEMDFGPFQFDGGLGLATFAAAMCLLSILPIAMNQFAVDKAGLTMTLLSPLTDAEVLAGKALGNALVVAPPTLICTVGALLLFGGDSPALWLALLLGLIAVYLIVAPIAAICSAVFPRAVNMNSIGRGSNAHGAAGLIGMLAFLAAGVPPLLLVFLATRVLDRPSLAPVLLAGWCVIAYVIARLLFVPARRIFVSRRENLAMLD